MISDSFDKYGLDPMRASYLLKMQSDSAVANSLRLPLNKWAVIRCHCLNPINGSRSSVFVTLRRNQSAGI